MTIKGGGGQERGRLRKLERRSVDKNKREIVLRVFNYRIYPLYSRSFIPMHLYMIDLVTFHL